MTRKVWQEKQNGNKTFLPNLNGTHSYINVLQSHSAYSPHINIKKLYHTGGLDGWHHAKYKSIKKKK